MDGATKIIEVESMQLDFSTKANTLSSLESRLKTALVLPQFCFHALEWEESKFSLLTEFTKLTWSESNLVVRSSSAIEDTGEGSLAGHFESVIDVSGRQALIEAVEKVLGSYSRESISDQVFVQPMLKDIRLSGVAFSRDPSTCGHYYVISYDEKTGLSDVVTSGASNDLSTLYCSKDTNDFENPVAQKVVPLLEELEEIFGLDALDIEFALTEQGALYLFQVRPLVLRNDDTSLDCQAQFLALQEIEKKIDTLNIPHPYLHGSRTAFGIMPDWNPAEIIGVRPRSLALSLYKELVTDNIWAYQRDNYGYRNLRSFPLMVDFSGLPYIDVRVSFNSFIPADIGSELAEKLANYYIESLKAAPQKHDKVEFEIIYSCYTLDLPKRLELLEKHGFSRSDCETLTESLRSLTNRIIHGKNGLWKEDIEKISTLEKRFETIVSSELDPVSKIYWLIEDCKRYGTLPFAGLARAGFIAVQLLRSLVSVEILSEAEYQRFMSTLKTIGTQLSIDVNAMGRDEFLSKYGHLRPGTYDVLSSRYDESPDEYFNWSNAAGENNQSEEVFHLPKEKILKLESFLEAHNISHDAKSLFEFIRASIEGREYAKFIFTKNLSKILSYMVEFGEGFDLSRDDISYAGIDVLIRLYSSSDDFATALKRSIAQNKEKYALTSQLVLPPLIVDSKDIFNFSLPPGEPNFITLRSVTASIVAENSDLNCLPGNIVMLPSADPGYDWIFSHGIGGFITMYGGANSHMAIRAAELGIPSVIGAGELLYKKWSVAQMLQIDCANKQVKVLQ